jgi:transposase
MGVANYCGTYPTALERVISPWLGEAFDKRRLAPAVLLQQAQLLRRVTTRYDKLLANFMGFLKLAAIASGSNS